MEPCAAGIDGTVMVEFKDMLIDTPYALLEIEDRGDREDPTTSECTYCRRSGEVRRYDSRDVVVVRRWREHSVWAPELNGPDNGGWFEWRCPGHPFHWNSSPYAENAPTHLRPTRSERCEDVTLKHRCTTRTGQRYEGRWLCEEHSQSVRARLRLEERLREIDEGLGDGDHDT